MVESAVINDRTRAAGASVETLPNYIGGRWITSRASRWARACASGSSAAGGTAHAA